jgi:endonuclease/exonuclease/phosphatase (EEP) superfamily protein YafD
LFPIALAALLHVFYLIGDRTWWAECVAIWPPIGWLVLFLPVVVRTRSWATGGLLVLLGVLYGEWPRLGSRPEPPRGAVRIAIWNVAGQPRSWEALRPLELDLVLVQESAGGPRPAWPGYEWFEGLDPAVLSRHRARRLPTRPIGPWTPPLMLEVELPGGKKLIVVNVRLVLPTSVTWAADGFRGNPREGFLARVGQYPRLADLLRDTQAATGVRSALVAGDFNAPARMPSFRPLRQLLVDAWTQAGVGFGTTATADLPLARIDQCWVTRDVQILSARVQKMPVSDHRLLLVELRL